MHSIDPRVEGGFHACEPLKFYSLKEMPVLEFLGIFEAVLHTRSAFQRIVFMLPMMKTVMVLRICSVDFSG